MATIPTIPTSNHEAISSQNGSISTADGKVICEIETGIPKNFVSANTSVCCSDSGVRLTKNTARGRRYRLLKRKLLPQHQPLLSELEYLETSGTQYIKVSDIFGTNNDLVMGRFMIPEKSLSGTQMLFGSRKMWRVDAFCLSFAVDADSLAQFAAQAMAFDCNPFLDKELQLIMSRAGCELNGTLVAEFAQATFTASSPYYLFTTTETGVIDTRMFIGRCYSFSIIRNGVIILDFVPVLNKDGEPGMWDKVNKRFFGNDGTGTFGYALKGQGESSTYSLRNPGVVPPSGVYARKSGENALDIIADTEELSGEDWEWFANVAEAYEHFGIVPEEIEELLTE